MEICLSIPSSRSNGIISLTASKMPLCRASWPSNSLAQALQQPQTEQPDSPEPHPQMLFNTQKKQEKKKTSIFKNRSCYLFMSPTRTHSIIKTLMPCWCVHLPSWYSVRPSTANTAGTIACTVSTHCAHHALVQLPFMHAWLAHHALFFLLFQLIFQVFIHGCGHALHTKCWNIHRKAGMPTWCKSIYFWRILAHLHLSTFSPFPAWLMDPVSLPHCPLLFTPNVHTSPFLVRTHVWALPIATWVTKWPFRSVTWPVEKKEKWIKIKYSFWLNDCNKYLLVKGFTQLFCFTHKCCHCK